jgi:hypothetical protein
MSHHSASLTTPLSSRSHNQIGIRQKDEGNRKGATEPKWQMAKVKLFAQNSNIRTVVGWESGRADPSNPKLSYYG